MRPESLFSFQWEDHSLLSFVLQFLQLCPILQLGPRVTRAILIINPDPRRMDRREEWTDPWKKHREPVDEDETYYVQLIRAFSCRFIFKFLIPG